MSKHTELGATSGVAGGVDTAACNRPDIQQLRKKLTGEHGRQYWRSLNEAADTEEFRALLEDEFPMHAAVWNDDVSRRRFLQLSGASLALAGLVGCGRQPLEHIVPYVRQPEDIIPGKPLYFASALTHSGYASGVLVETHMGRPTKIEGNPEHPASLGATSAQTQAAILDFYDPDRSQVVTHLGRILTWSSFQSDIASTMQSLRALKGEGLRILTETTTSPTFARQVAELKAAMPNARWHQYEPAGRTNVWKGAELAFGQPLDTYYDLSKADVIVTIDCDLLGDGPGHVRYARQFADARRLADGATSMNRLYALESTPTQTGSIADHRLALAPSQLWKAVTELSRSLDRGAAVPKGDWLPMVAADLIAHRGRSLIAVGQHAPAEIHALVHALNDVLGNVGHTLFHTDPVATEGGDQLASLAELAEDMRAGRVDTLVIMGGNPVFNAPHDVRFAEAMDGVALRVHLSLHQDETSELCHWHLPAAHPLETWSDARAFDGTATILQPMIAPLYDGHSSHELMALLMAEDGASPATGFDLVQATWRDSLGPDFAERWEKAVHDGVIPDSQAIVQHPLVNLRQVARTASRFSAASSDRTGVTLILRPDPSIGDGRYANNGWLQELPKPWTRLTWENALLISPSLAEELGLHNEDVVAITAGDARLEAPAWIVPGHAAGAATLHLGYGRRRGGHVQAGAGVDAYPLLESGVGYERPATLEKTGRSHSLACTQDHFLMQGRDLVRTASLAEYQKHPDFAHAHGHGAADVSMFPPHEYPGHAWGVTIDTGSCIGCNACVVACNAENNIPVVGKEQVQKAREMHWLRIDRYFVGDLDNPQVAHQPVMCMHCENAPCEQVCPVAATTHSAEGLNDMVYNRCVGTRYCSNNCPYKVRRFNFLQFQDYDSPSLKLMRNPDVSVRHRGVMEKCTYCVQRINQARIDAKRDGHDIEDGAIQSACQQACPTQAIVFGDINDPNSKVSRLKSAPLNYTLLDEVNVKPRTSYLATVRNPHPSTSEEGHS